MISSLTASWDVLMVRPSSVTVQFTRFTVECSSPGTEPKTSETLNAICWLLKKGKTHRMTESETRRQTNSEYKSREKEALEEEGLKGKYF